jgi:hypothetical protein
MDNMENEKEKEISNSKIKRKKNKKTMKMEEYSNEFEETEEIKSNLLTGTCDIRTRKPYKKLILNIE